MEKNNWKSRTLLLGTIIGALTGLGAAYMLVRRVDDTEQHPRLTAGDGVKLGAGIIGFLRLVADLAKK
jgi:hypothetical protein